MRVEIEKSVRTLTVFDGNQSVFVCRVALGKCPIGHKTKSGDMKTPEGNYFACLKKEGKFGPSIGVSYPNLEDAERGVETGLISSDLLPLFDAAQRTRQRPPWGTALGGEIYIHAGGAQSDWTAGCIALKKEDMDKVYKLVTLGDDIVIRP